MTEIVENDENVELKQETSHKEESKDSSGDIKESMDLDENKIQSKDKNGKKGLFNVKSKKTYAKSKDKEEKLKEKIEKLEYEVTESQNRALRALAEAENTRKQSEKQRLELIKYGIQPLAREILEVRDNFSRALQLDENDNQNIDSLKEGLELTLKEFEGILEKFNIKKISPIGEMFNPNLHQAMYEGESTDYDAGLICEVIQDGYVFHDRLLRPALVGISKKTDKIEEDNNNENNDKSK